MGLHKAQTLQAGDKVVASLGGSEFQGVVVGETADHVFILCRFPTVSEVVAPFRLGELTVGDSRKDTYSK